MCPVLSEPVGAQREAWCSGFEGRPAWGLASTYHPCHLGHVSIILIGRTGARLLRLALVPHWVAVPSGNDPCKASSTLQAPEGAAVHSLRYRALALCQHLDKGLAEALLSVCWCSLIPNW